jgi:GNAT superfamily N-acetyltransferase
MIRRALNKDIDKILILLKEVNLIHAINRPDIFNEATKYNNLELENKILNEPIFVYEENGEVYGYIFGKIIEVENQLFKKNKIFFIDDFCIDETKRGQNIGTKLYNYVKEYAKEIKCDKIELNVWNFNERAYKFYLKCGLKPLEITMEEIL